MGLRGCAAVMLLVMLAREACAYIDPGTGGQVFSSLAPIIGICELGLKMIWAKLAPSPERR